MKIVNVEDYFHPEAGYQLNVLSKYLSMFGNDVVIITAELKKMPSFLTDFFGKDDIEEKDRDFSNNTGVKVIRLPIACYKSGRALFWTGLIEQIRNENPDVLYVHGNDTYTAMYLLLLRRKIHCPIILDSHMVDMASKNHFKNIFRWFYRRFITPIIISDKIPVIRTAPVDYIEKRLGIPISQAPCISFGSNMTLFHPNEDNRIAFREENGISLNAFVVIYAGKLDSAKGGLFLSEALVERLATSKELVFLIIGNAVRDIQEEIEDNFGRSQNKIIRFKTQKYQSLPVFFQAADLAIFPKQCSLTFFDVQACGLPVLFENNEVNKYRCRNNAWMFAGEDIADFRKKIEFIVSIPDDEYAEYKKNAYKYIKDNYDYEKCAREYEKVIHSLV